MDLERCYLKFESVQTVTEQIMNEQTSSPGLSLSL